MNSGIERLAKEAGMVLLSGLVIRPDFFVASHAQLAKFAALVAESCARECESQLADGECPERAQYCADAIRAKLALSHETPEAK